MSAHRPPPSDAPPPAPDAPRPPQDPPPPAPDAPSSPSGRQFGGDLLTEIFTNTLDPAYAEAAGSGRAPTLTGRVSRVITLVAIGLLLSVAYLKVIADAPQATQVRLGLIADIHQEQQSTDTLKTSVDRVRGDVTAMRDAALTDAGGDVAYLRGLEARTGLAAVTGDGITVTLGDAEEAKDPVTGKPRATTSGKVYDRDLQRVVNALWSVGAEAITVNDQRLSGTSAIRKAGGAILVNFRPLSGPYTITAIGPDNLRRRFDATATARQFRGYVGQYGMSFTVADADDLILPAVGMPPLDYAQSIPREPVHPSPSSTGGD